MDRNTTGQRSFRRAAGAALLLAATLTTISAIAAAAEAPAAPAARIVKVSDLNLTSPQGQQTLARRLRTAVNQVCAPSAGENRLRVSRSKVEECREAAWADAQRQLQQHGLLAWFAARR